MRALTSKVYSVFPLKPITVMVPQVAAVCQIAEAPSVPSACTNKSPVLSWMAKSTEVGLPLAAIATSKLLAVGLFTVGAEGTMARVYLLAVEPKLVSVPSPFLALTWKVYAWFTLNPVTVLVPQPASVAHTAEPPKLPSPCT